MILTLLFNRLAHRCIHGHEKVPEHPEADSLSTNILCCVFHFMPMCALSLDEIGSRFV